MKNIFTIQKYATVLALILITITGFSCDGDRDVDRAEVSETSPAIDTSTVKQQEKEVVEKPEPKPIVTYHIDSLASTAEIDSFNTRYSEPQQKTIFALNRMDAWRLSPGNKIVVPDSISEDFLTYSPFPEELDVLDSIPKAILINQRVQGIALYEDGKLIRWGPTSSGKQATPTPNGLHYGNHKAQRKVSTVNPDWILPYYFNFMNFEGVGVHQYSMPGYPASHACVRLLMEDAKFIYDWAEQWKLNENRQVVVKNGTPFMVFGEYDYENQLPPWLRMAANSEDNFLNEAELDTLEAYRERYFQDERNFKKVDEKESEDELSV